MKKSINYILLPLYKLWHKVVEKFKATDSGLELDGSLLINGKPVQVALVVNNIKEMTDEEIDGLKVGDVVAKKTGDMYHCYVVSYKEEHHGICLTYVDASVAETQSYDYTEGHWVYNSEDKTELGGHTDAEIKALAKEEVESASSGTIVDSLGLDGNGDLVKGAVSAGIKLYRHYFTIANTAETVKQTIDFISKRSTPYSALYEVFGKYDVVCVQPLTSTSGGGSITLIDLGSSGGSDLYKVVIDSNGVSYSMSIGGYNKILPYTPIEL